MNISTFQTSTPNYFILLLLRVSRPNALGDELVQVVAVALQQLRVHEVALHRLESACRDARPADNHSDQ